jgi:ribosomal protein S15P/S13E
MTIKAKAKVEKLEEKKETNTKKKTTKAKKITQKEYEKMILDLAKKGLTAEKIGETLRKQGVHPKEFKGKIGKILGDKYINPDLKNVEEKLERIKAHYENNKQDKRAKREKDRIFSQLRNLKLYFKIPIIKKKKK